MRWMRFEREGKVSFGIVEGNESEGEEAVEVAGTPFGEYTRTGARFPMESVRLLPPVIPPTFYAAGLNYPEHAKKYAAKEGRQPNLPKKPDVGYRAVNALIAHGEPVIVPADAGERVHYEGELVVVIGTRAKHLSREDALTCVLGYTIGNDVSERDWQNEDRTLWRAKNTDTWKPMGPWIETDIQSQAGLESMVTTVRVNGETTIEFPTHSMIFGVAEYIAAITRYVTLHPGDVIWMGTEGESPNLKAGDVCEVEISGVGLLRNPFAAE